MSYNNRSYRSNADIARRRAAMKRRKKMRQRRMIALAVFAGLLLAVIIAVIAVISFRGNIKSTVVIEAGDPVPQAQDFMKTPKDSITCETDLSQINSLEPGDYPVVFTSGLLSKTSTLQIRDTIPPVATAKDVKVALGTTVNMADFIESLSDRTSVSVSYVTAPDFTKVGKTPVQLLLTDRGGNQVTLDANLEVFDDTEPPVITGAKDIKVYVGETAAYRTGIEVTDNKDASPKLSIDSSAVDLDTPGVYKLIYTATDSVGNTSSVEVNVTVAERPENYDDIQKVNQKADEIIAKLGITSETPEVDKAFAIFRWVRKNVPWYGGRIKQHDPVAQALKGLAGNSGDCYTCAVTCQALLDRAGFETKFLERRNNLGYHYWLMVKVEGNWYHMDPSPIYIRQFICFLGTDAQIKWFSTDMRPGYYDHDYSSYPATPDSPLATVEYKNDDYVITGGLDEEVQTN